LQNKTQEKVITTTKYILDNELAYGAVQGKALHYLDGMILLRAGSP
jgi:hypothetical protein